MTEKVNIAKILNCGEASQYSDKVRFKYRCSKQWQEFQATKNETIRFCDACQENVYYCNDKKEADSHARQGHCIAISFKLSLDIYSQFTPDILGRPDTDGLWASDIFNRSKHELVKLLQSQELKASDLSRLDLSHVDLSGLDLSNANLSHTDLTNTNLNNADLSNSNLSHARLNRANLSHANLRGANFYNSSISDANFDRAIMTAIDIRNLLKDNNSSLFFHSRNISDPRFEAPYDNLTGEAYNSQGRKEKAEECFQKALQISTKRGDRFEESEARANMAALYGDLESDKAIKLYQEAISIKTELGDTYGAFKLNIFIKILENKAKG